MAIERPVVDPASDSILDKSLGGDSDGDTPAPKRQLAKHTILNTDWKVLQTTYNQIQGEREKRLQEWQYQ